MIFFPAISRTFVLPKALPDNIASDYREASKLLAVSPAASAAFARRCLQTILKNQNYRKSKLVHQIDDVLKETNPAKVVPHYITTRLDAVRNFGNFSAHETENRATAEILDVEPGEAEWCIEIPEDLIEHYFVRPAAEQAKIDSLNGRPQASRKSKPLPPRPSPLKTWPELTRRRDHDRREECWLIYYGDIHVGTIAIRSGSPIDTDHWQWRCGFYPGSYPGECKSGIAATFDEAGADFEQAWKVFLSKRTESDFKTWRDQRDWTAEKYRNFDRGERMPPDWKPPRRASG